MSSLIKGSGCKYKWHYCSEIIQTNKRPLNRRFVSKHQRILDSYSGVGYRELLGAQMKICCQVPELAL